MPDFLRRPAPLRSHLVLLAAVLLAGCGGLDAARVAPTPAPVPVDWGADDLHVEAGEWVLRRCASDAVAICVDRGGEAAGYLLLEDLPSLGQELTASQDQVQATLAVRTQTVYRLLREHRTQRCGPDYAVETDRPERVPAAAGVALRYGATGGREGRVEERTVGYRIFRDGIETLIEATAVAAGACLEPTGPTFTPDALEKFAPLLDRIVAGSILPEPTRFEGGPAVPGGSMDPRMEQAPTNGIAISHGLE